MFGGSTMLAAKEQAFIDLHTQHSTRVYRYIAYRISDRHRAEELAADVFRIAWEKQLTEPPGIGWLLATARNVLGNEYKGRRRRQELVERLQDEARNHARGPEPENEDRAAVADVLARLRERDREVLMLSYWDELTTAELAQTLGCSSSAAAVRLHRARRAFAKAAPAHLMTERKD
jgi:RNA polymerase sigma-70 factor (ECF subfamily)